MEVIKKQKFSILVKKYYPYRKKILIFLILFRFLYKYREKFINIAVLILISWKKQIMKNI